MNKHGGEPSLYDRLGAIIYDVGSRAVFFPLGGIDVLREKTVDTLKVEAGSRVLELGCGTGGLTRMLIKRGANVVAIDQSEAMLRRARRNAPEATFVRSDILNFKPDYEFDRVLLAFVLHHMEADARLVTLNLARTALKPGGLVAVLDWAQPDSATLGWTLHAFLTAVEPSSALDLIQQGIETHLEQAGLVPVRSSALAKGVAKILVASSAT
ncbi:MAG: class I SAM-dependent methyltransferase [Acidobacteriota bacterium]|nr:class I SAM-dependent methyltransferase [Acidobacteriota bacterium]